MPYRIPRKVVFLLAQDLFMIILGLMTYIMQDVMQRNIMNEAMLLATMVRDDIVKVQRYYEDIVPEMMPDKYMRTFRMRPETMDALFQFLQPDYRQGSGGVPQTLPTKMVAMTTAYLGSKDTIFKLAHLFGVTEDTFLRCTDKVMALMISKIDQIIKWPNKSEYEQLAREFDQTGRYFPNVIGCIDGLHLKIQVTEEDRISYYNYKRFHSIHLMGTCTADRRFININIGWPGRAHDSKVFKRSPLCRNLATLMHIPGRVLENTYHIVGDSAYPSSTELLTPYRNTGRGLSFEQRKYNMHLASKRQVIERAFELLGRRFPRILYLNQQSLGKKIRIAVCCCILHNICIMANDSEDFLEETHIEIFPPATQGMPNEQHANLKKDLISRRIALGN